MKRKLILSLVVISLLVANKSPAAVFERDWKESGDGLLTYDDVNQREWLDLGETIIADFSGGYDEIMSEVERGGIFDGFTVANGDDVSALAESAGIITSTQDFDVNGASSNRLIDLLGRTAISAPSVFASGLLDVFGMNCDCDDAAVIRVVPPLPEAGLTLFLASNAGGDNPDAEFGVFLYRTRVPEPTTFILLCFIVLPIFHSGIRTNRMMSV